MQASRLTRPLIVVRRSAISMNTQYSDPYAFQKKKNAKSGRGELLKGYTVGSMAPPMAVKSGSTIAEMGTSYGAPTLTHPNPHIRFDLHPSSRPHSISRSHPHPLSALTLTSILALTLTLTLLLHPHHAGISARLGGRINGKKVSAVDEAPKDGKAENAALVFSVLSIATLFFANAPSPQ